MKLFSALFLTAAIMVQFGCGSKNIQLDQDRMLIGDWQLISMQNGEETISNITYKVLYQFTADRQLVILTNEDRDVSKYVYSNNTLFVNDGVVTQIKEKIQVKKLDKTELILAFNMDGKSVQMTFTRKSKALN